MKPILIGAVSGALVLSALAVLPVVPAAAATVDSRVGDLVSRPEAPGVGPRRLTSATVRQDLYADRVSGTFVLDAEPVGAGTTSYLRVSFGTLDGSSCDAAVEYVTDTVAPDNGFTRSGRTLTLRRTESQAGYADWDCAFAVLDLETDGDLDDGSLRSVLIGPLRDVAARPDLAITEVELLGSRGIRLVQGVWTTIDVTVANRGRGDATGTVVTGSGRGLQVRTARYGTVGDDSLGTERVQVRLVGDRSTSLRLTVRGGGVRATRMVKVRKIQAPARPRAGRYRGGSGDVTFAISRGTARITGFRVSTQTRCGGFPDPFTYTRNTYDFPAVAIRRDGIVDARDRGELYGVTLRLRVDGGRVSAGRFTYSGPNRCFASESFTARRVGR